MKKILALVLAMIMALSMGVAFADELSTATITKKYNMRSDKDGNGNGIGVPKEALTLSFSCTEIQHAHTDEKYTNLKDVDLPSMANYDINSKTFTLSAPDLKYIGVYTYLLTEKDAGTAGVNYDSAGIYVQYIATYVWNETDNKQEIKVDGPYLVDGPQPRGDSDSDGKKSDFTNTYVNYDLTINKIITGNMAVFSDEFTVTLTFTSEQPVKTDITYKGVGDTNAKTITGMTDVVDAENKMGDWTESGYIYTATVDVTVGGSEKSTAYVYDIPAGVSVKVEETTLESKDYSVEYAVDKGSKQTTVPTVDMSLADHTVTITNTNEQNPNTGILLDNAPYMIIMALVLVGAAMMLKRRAYND